MRRSRLIGALAVASLAAGWNTSFPALCEARGGFARRRARPVVETVDTRPENQLAPTGQLGTFQQIPILNVRSNGIIGGGYSPIGLYGANNSMDLYGPIAATRQTSAPINTVVRGYNGVATAVDGTSFSNPFRPELSPVQYPTRNSNFTGVRPPRVPNQTGNGILWVDQN